MRIHVIGLGNVLMGDDGFGPSVIERFASEREVLGDVSLTDAGTPGLDLLPFILDADALLIVDTVQARGRPGELRIYQKACLLEARVPSRMGPHDPALSHALQTRELAGPPLIAATLIGVIPARVAVGPGLSHPVRSRIPDVLDILACDLSRLGCETRRRAPERIDPPWWEAPIANYSPTLAGPSAPDTRMSPPMP